MKRELMLLALMTCTSCVTGQPKDYLERPPGLHELSITNNTDWICEIELKAASAHSVEKPALTVELRSFMLPGATHRFDILPDTYDFEILDRKFGRRYYAGKWDLLADTETQLTIGSFADQG